MTGEGMSGHDPRSILRPAAEVNHGIRALDRARPPEVRLTLAPRCAEEDKGSMEPRARAPTPARSEPHALHAVTDSVELLRMSEEPEAFELRLNDHRVGVVHWRSTQSYESAVAETATHRWTFDRQGRLRRRVIIREATAGEPVARFEWGFWRGTLQLSDGRLLRWPQVGARGFRDKRGFMVRFEPKPGSDVGYTVSIGDPSLTQEDLALLSLLGVYLIWLSYTDVAADAELH